MKSTNTYTPPKKAKPKKAKKYHPYIEAVFLKPYNVMVRSGDILSIKEQRFLGTHVTGNRGIDEAASRALVSLHIPISEMVNYFREGISVYLVNHKDSKSIYEAVRNHTSTWRVSLSTAFNVGNAPVEDLIDMERFVSVIYERAKFEYIKKPSKDLLMTGTLADFLYNGTGLSAMGYDQDNQLITGGVDINPRSVKNDHYTPDVGVFQQALINSVGFTHERH